MSADQVNRLQREAIDALTTLILEKEDELRQAESHRLRERLPVPNYSHIFGVKRFQELLLPILIKQSEPWIISICGIGGIGKTAVTDFLIRSNIANLPYSDISWVRIPSKRNIGEISGYVIQALARQLLPEPTPFADQLSQIRNVLKKKAYPIVLDNIEEGFDSIEFVDCLKSLINPTRIILTGRNLPLETSEFFVARIPELSLSDSGQLLNYQVQITGLNQDISPHTEAIYRIVGGNPLALKLLVGLLHTWSLHDAMEVIRHSRGNQPDDLFNTVFQNAWTALGDKPRAVLEAMIFAGNEGINPNHVAGITNFSIDEVRESIRDLALRSLVERRGGIDANNYGIHPLTSTFLHNLTRNTTAETHELTSQFVASNIHYWKDYLHAANVYEVFRVNRENLRLAIEFAFEFSKDIEATWLILKLYSPILSERLAGQWIGFFRRGLEFANSTNKAELKFELSQCLGSLYWQIGQYDTATESFHLAKEAAEANNWKGKLVSAQIGISMILWSEGHYKEAGQAARSAYKLAVNTDLPTLKGKTLAILGIIAFAQRKYPSAIRNFSRAGKYFKHGDPEIFAQLLLNRGMAYR